MTLGQPRSEEKRHFQPLDGGRVPRFRRLLDVPYRKEEEAGRVGRLRVYVAGDEGRREGG